MVNATDALCAQTDPELFFPGKGHPTGTAAAVCRHCPVRAACLSEAIERDERYGIWGGLTTRQRDKLTADTAAA